MITASAPGKCILMGEHAVVYGHPAIAIAIDIRSYCSIEPISKKLIEFQMTNYDTHLKFHDLTEMKKQMPPQFSQFSEVLGVLMEKFDIQIESISIRLYTDLWSGAGLGSSASVAVAFLCAISEFYNLNLSVEKINEYAFFMEKIVHGTPSGIDNAICSSGGALIYQNGVPERILLPKFSFLITYSGLPHDTGSILSSLRKKRDYLDGSLIEIEKITEKGIKAIKDKNFTLLGELCNLNQEILSNIGVSTSKMDEIIAISRENGAYGSKLTGAGVGGCVLTLGDISQLHKIQFILKKLGYSSKITHLDYNGGRIESK